MDLSREMTITVKQLQKSYNRTLIFKNLDYVFETGKITAILGPNGSGKSTLLRVLSTQLEPDNGTVEFTNPKINLDMAYQKVGYVAPYIDIPEEFSFKELLEFHSKFKSPLIHINEIINKCMLTPFANKPIKEFSSGMKQRVKLSLNFFFNNSIYLFDEPCSHLDVKGFEWFNNNVCSLTKYGVVIIASNNPEEIKHASQTIDIQHLKY